MIADFGAAGLPTPSTLMPMPSMHRLQCFLPSAASPGHRGAYLLRRDVDGGAEFLAVTLWESRQSIAAFAGNDIDKAVVEPEARALLCHFDDFATHYEVVPAAA